MMIFKRFIPRRTFFRGLGATVALPFLDAMVPAFAALENTAAKRPQRLSIFNVPNGMHMEAWTPVREGDNFEMSPVLQPLNSFKDRLLVLTGLAQNEGRGWAGEVGGEHPRASATWLTCSHPKMTAGPDIMAGISVDQIAAQEIGKDTQLRSLELCLESSEYLGACEALYSCAYYNTVSWSNATTPLPMENNPRVVFERFFGPSDSTDSATRLARIGRRRSILDFVSESAARLQKDLGPSDRIKISQYLEAVREVERSIQVAEEQASSQEMPILDRPAGVPPTFEEHIKLMFDLEALAFQGDLTRVCTFMLAHEMGPFSYPQLGAAETFHALTHHQGDPKKIEMVVKTHTYNVKMFSHFLEKLQSTPDGDGSLLDHTLILYGASLGDGNLHLHYDLPVLLVTGGPAQLKGGRHVRYPKDTPMANLYLLMLEKLGVKVGKLGDATGKLELLSV